MKVSKNFEIREFIPPEIFNDFGDNCIWFISKFMVDFSQFIRDRFGFPVFINTYHLSSQPFQKLFTDSGFRSPSSNVGSKLSQHRFKCAVDLKFIGISPEEVRDDIRKNFSVYNAITGLTTIERNTETWLHGDCRKTGIDILFEVNP